MSGQCVLHTSLTDVTYISLNVIQYIILAPHMRREYSCAGKTCVRNKCFEPCSSHVHTNTRKWFWIKITSNTVCNMWCKSDYYYYAFCIISIPHPPYFYTAPAPPLYIYIFVTLPKTKQKEIFLIKVGDIQYI